MLCVVLISASCLSAVWAWAEIPSARQQTKRRGPRANWRLFLITDSSSFILSGVAMRHRELLPTNYATAQSEECKIMLQWIRGLMPLFTPQRDHRIDFRRPPRRNPASHGRHQDQQRRNHRERRRVGRFYFKQQVLHQLRQPIRQKQAGADAD